MYLIRLARYLHFSLLHLHAWPCHWSICHVCVQGFPSFTGEIIHVTEGKTGSEAIVRHSLVPMGRMHNVNWECVKYICCGAVVLQEVKQTGPDYEGADPEEAVRDFEKRIANYVLAYQTLDHVLDKYVHTGSFSMPFLHLLLLRWCLR